MHRINGKNPQLWLTQHGYQTFGKCWDRGDLIPICCKCSQQKWVCAK